MASNTRGPRGRSRKQRQGAAERAAKAAAERSSVAPPRRRRAPAYRDFDERPQAPWHPLPLSELLILAGAIAFVIAMLRLSHHGVGSAAPLLLAGILAVGLGTAEVSWREHRSGFRSHTLLLAFVPALALHTLVVGGYAAFASPPQALNIGMLVVDVAVFLALARSLRARFLDARARRDARTQR
jgi:hypothetical protein